MFASERVSRLAKRAIRRPFVSILKELLSFCFVCGLLSASPGLSSIHVGKKLRPVFCEVNGNEPVLLNWFAGLIVAAWSISLVRLR